MIILGIDPGFSCSGFSILKKDGTRVLLIDYGFLKLPVNRELPVRVGLFHSFFKEKIERWKVSNLALETPFLGKNAQNFLKLGYLRGILYLLADTYTLSLQEFAPREVKQAVTGFGGADKDQVARIMLRLFPSLTVPQKADVTDAVAISLCGLWKYKPHHV